MQLHFLPVFIFFFSSTKQQIVADSMMAQLELAADGFIDDTDLDEECRQQLYDVEYEVSINLHSFVDFFH